MPADLAGGTVITITDAGNLTAPPGHALAGAVTITTTGAALRVRVGHPLIGGVTISITPTSLLGIAATVPGAWPQQVISVAGASGGTFTITLDGQTTTAIAYDANAATVQAALEALSNVAPGDIFVTGSLP